MSTSELIALSDTKSMTVYDGVGIGKEKGNENISGQEEGANSGVDVAMPKLTIVTSDQLEVNESEKEMLDGVAKSTMEIDESGAVTEPNTPSSWTGSRGKWTDEEDEILRKAVQEHSGKNWKKISNLLEGRTGRYMICFVPCRRSSFFFFTLSPFLAFFTNSVTVFASDFVVSLFSRRNQLFASFKLHLIS